MPRPPTLRQPSGKGPQTVTPVRRLPRSGRLAAAPPWPLSGPLSEEGERWAALWRLPQALLWEESQVTHAVARYARLVVSVEERPEAPMLGRVESLEDRLGLTPKSMRLLAWVVVDDEVSEFPDGLVPGGLLPSGRKARARRRVPTAATGTDDRRLWAVE
jgi:hypothetical protein